MRRNYHALGLILAGFVAFVCKPVGFRQDEITTLVSRPFPDTLTQQFPAGWDDLLSTTQRTVWLVTSTIDVGYGIFMETEGRQPGSMSEFCREPYMPVPCSEILNPFTGKPILEAAPGTLGRIDFEAPPSPTALKGSAYYSITVPDWENDPASTKVLRMLRPVDYSPDFEPLDKSLAPAWISARATAGLVSRAIFTFDQCKAGPPGSWEELAAFAPYLRKLRNGFSGGYAKPVFERTVAAGAPPEAQGELMKELERFKGNPGDFAIFWGPGAGPLRVVVFGQDGRDIDKTLDELRLRKMGIDPVRHIRTSNPLFP